MSSEPRRVAGAAVELLDAGDGRRLDRFGPRVLDRPAPTALDPRRDPAAWPAADLAYHAASGWSAIGSALAAPTEAWPVEVDGLTLELRPTASGGVGLFPEQAANLAWLDRMVRAAQPGDPGDPGDPGAPTVLNLFAHTGLLTLAAARAGAAVAHVDAARTAVAWARRNAELSGLADRPIRWLVEDAAALVAREARRGRRYDGIVLDPPSFGRAGRRHWRLEDDLAELLAGCAAILSDGGLVLLTAHTAGVGGPELEGLVREALPAAGRIVTSRLTLGAASGAVLDLGWSVRVVGR